MSHAPQLRIPATYLRGGTSKGVFFRLDDLPEAARVPGPARDALFLRVIGSPDPYGKHIDGMGGATSSTSKCVIVSTSSRPGHDVDYLYGQVSIDSAFVDWSGNCGNLSTAVGPFAIANGLVDPARVPRDGTCTVRIWQANIGKTIVAHVPMRGGEVLEAGDFELDGVAFPGAEVELEFLDPAAGAGAGDAAGTLFPTGRRIDRLAVPGLGDVEATLIDAGNPTVFIDAARLGLQGTEGPLQVNARPDLLALAEAVRAQGACVMGLATSPAQASAERLHTPKLALVARPAGYVASDGRAVTAGSIDLLARIFSMGPLHHAMTGTGAVAIAVAAAIPGTLVHRVAPVDAQGRVRFGHPSGRLAVGAEVEPDGDAWVVRKVTMGRSARRLMDGWVRVPPWCG